MLMLRKITLLTAFMAYIVCAQAQGIKFGVHVDPLISFMGSNDKKITSDGVNLGLDFGVEMEVFFGGGDENYAFTFGASFGLGKGGALKYTDKGILFPRSTLDNSAYFNDSNQSAAAALLTGDSLKLTAGTSVKYSANYISIPIGLKLRTNELGDSYMRAFFHLPIASVLVPVSARARVNAPKPTETTFEEFYTDSPSKGEVIYKEIIPIQLMLGLGAGVEYSPNEEGGLRLVGGIYYQYGFFDTVKSNLLYDNITTTYKANKATSGFHNIALRIGIIF
jgi:hypothetical protein